MKNAPKPTLGLLRHPAKKNRGVALIMALMVFALVTAVSASIMTQLARERDLLSQMQKTTALKQQLIGGEAWARHTFALMKNSTLPAASEAPLILKTQTFNLDNDDDSMKVVILDRQNCYNLNRLADNDVNELALQEVERLLTSINLDKTIAEQLKDWVDDDQNITGSTGHEDEFYQALTPTFRTADSKLVSVTELGLLQFTEKTLKTLVPNFCFWPEDIGVNINRVSNNVLKALLPDLSSEKESALLAQITTSGFTTLDDFLNHSSVAGLTIEKRDWRVDLAFVDVFVDVTLGDRSMALHTKLYKADNGTVSSYYRAYGANRHLQTLFGIPSTVSVTKTAE